MARDFRQDFPTVLDDWRTSTYEFGFDGVNMYNTKSHSCGIVLVRLVHALVILIHRYEGIVKNCQVCESF
jgi:hypothetical protein